MKCPKCNRKMTSISTVIPVEYLDETPSKSYEGRVRRGLPDWKTCFPCNKVYKPFEFTEFQNFLEHLRYNLLDSLHISGDYEGTMEKVKEEINEKLEEIRKWKYE